MMIHEIQADKSVKSKPRKRIGRGESSGWGKTAGRGNKGYGQRSGPGPHVGHEGGQLPYFRRIPKRGFSNFKFQTVYQIVNIGKLNEKFNNNEEVNPETLFAKRLIRDANDLVKILGNGELKKSLTVKAHKFSTSAIQAIENAGGRVEVIK